MQRFHGILRDGQAFDVTVWMSRPQTLQPGLAR